MEEKLTQYLDKIVEALEEGMAFTGEQAPLFIQELLQYAFWMHLMWLITWIIVFSICVFFIVTCFREVRHQSILDMWELPGALAVLCSIGPVIGIAHNANMLLMTIIAPRVYLVEKVSNLF